MATSSLTRFSTTLTDVTPPAQHRRWPTLYAPCRTLCKLPCCGPSANGWSLTRGTEMGVFRSKHQTDAATLRSKLDAVNAELASVQQQLDESTTDALISGDDSLVFELTG